MASSTYDIVIVGAGIAGSALAHALVASSSTSRSKSLRVALLERSLAEPDRIVGELLQPGGVSALRTLGMESCLEGIDAIRVKGYCVVKEGEAVHIPYPGTHEGRSFHHGRFVVKLREKAQSAPGVDVVEATASELVLCELTGRVLGVRAARKDSDAEKESFFADLVVVADGCFSNFRSAVMGPTMHKPATRSHFVGAVLEDAQLPMPQHGTVALVPGHGPVLLYQIGEHDTRMLVDVKQPLPSDLKVRSAVLSSVQFPRLSIRPEPHPVRSGPKTTRVPPSAHPEGAREGSPAPHAELIPSGRRAGRAAREGGRVSARRRVEHAASAHRWRHDRRAERCRDPLAHARKRV